MRPDIAYVLSDQFDYDLLISPDVGPAIAEDYGWDPIGLKDLNTLSPKVCIFDNRIAAPELAEVDAEIRRRRSIVILRVVDPGWFKDTLDQPWYEFVCRVIDEPNVRLMLPYSPAEFTALVLSRSQQSEYIFAPYLYREENELPLRHDERAHRVLVSGGIGFQGYPVRSHFRRQSRIWPPLRLMTDYLPHPGYPDIGQAKIHSLTGASYIEKLSKYRFALVCSARTRSEILKYREFAYAGVVPVGDLPWTLIDCPDDAWIQYGGDGPKVAKTIRTCRDTEPMAERFRTFMRGARNRTSERGRVNTQLRRLAGTIVA